MYIETPYKDDTLENVKVKRQNGGINAKFYITRKQNLWQHYGC